MDKFFAVLILIIAMAGFTSSINNSIEKSIEKQDTMLCESAKVSGNIKYTEKCSCYYESGDVKCMQK